MTTVKSKYLDRLLDEEVKYRFNGSGRKGNRAAVLEQLALERLQQLKHERKQAAAGSD